jgi:hypothetical protein
VLPLKPNQIPRLLTELHPQQRNLVLSIPISHSVILFLDLLHGAADAFDGFVDVNVIVVFDFL